MLQLGKKDIFEFISAKEKGPQSINSHTEKKIKGQKKKEKKNGGNKKSIGNGKPSIVGRGKKEEYIRIAKSPSDLLNSAAESIRHSSCRK